jgi:hypothetical protein
MFQTVFVLKIKIHVMLDNIFLKIVPFMRYVEKYSGAVQTADGSLVGCMRFACWITEVTNTHSEYVILLFSTATVVT